MMYLHGFAKVLGVALALGLALVACGSDDQPGQGNQPGAGRGGESGEGGDASPLQLGGGLPIGGGPSAPECPTDFALAEGTSCEEFGDGALCTSGSGCGPAEAIKCVDGTWQRQQALAIPC